MYFHSCWRAKGQVFRKCYVKLSQVGSESILICFLAHEMVMTLVLTQVQAP